MNTTELALVLSGLIVAGCVTTSPSRTEQAVLDLVSARTGTAESPEIAALLAKPLSADDAVRIALVGNRGLQSTYQELGIAQAELAEAVLLPNPVFDGAARYASNGDVSPEASLTMNLVDLITIPFAAARAAHERDAAKLRVAHEALTLAAEVRIAMYELLAAEQMLIQQRSFAETAAAAAELASRQKKAGTLPEVERTVHQLAAEQAKLKLSRLERDIRMHRRMLDAYMGLWGEQTSWKRPGSSRISQRRTPTLPRSKHAR